MIQGRVNSRYEATIPILLYASDGSEYTFTALIDTGCNTDMIVSEATVRLLGLADGEAIYMRQADDMYTSAMLYEGEVKWNGNRKTVRIVCMGDSVLVGMGLMRTHRLHIDINPSGPVIID